MGWPSRRGKVQAAGLHLSCDLTSPRAAGRSRLQRAEGETGSLRIRGTIKRSHSSRNVTDWREASGGPLQHSYDGKYCRSRLRLTSSPQASRAVLPSVCLWHRVRLPPPHPPLDLPWFRDCEEPTKRGAAVIFTLSPSGLRVWQKSGGMCVYLRGGEAGLGFVCFGAVVLALVPPPTGIHCCLFGHQLRPLTFPNGWLIPAEATVGPLFQQCCLPLVWQGEKFIWEGKKNINYFFF